jgi:hypothetical protein
MEALGGERRYSSYSFSTSIGKDPLYPLDRRLNLPVCWIHGLFNDCVSTAEVVQQRMEWKMIMNVNPLKPKLV